MNFRKFRKNVKALSPVVASIILIAITVAVAAWMGGMSIGFMQTEQLTITQAQFTAGGGMVITVSNTGTNAITISTIQVNGVAPSGTTLYKDSAGTALSGTTIPANTQGATITLATNNTWVNGNNYLFKIVSAKGNTFQYTAVAA